MTALQQAIDMVLAQPIGDESSKLVRWKIIGLLHGYDARWLDAGYRSIFVEETLTAHLTNLKTNARSRTFNLAGKLDVVAELDGRTYVIDHKTCSQDIADPDAPFWRQLAIEGQVSHYHLLGWENGIKFDGAVWDAVRKPSIAPKKLTKAEKTSAVGTGKYFGWDVSAEDKNHLQTEDREPPRMYAARLAHDCTVERPDWYFQRRPVPRLDDELAEYALELWDHGQEILHVRNTERHVRNSGACMLYNTPCQFLGICSGYDTPDSERWVKKTAVHSELPLVNGDGRDILTNSRIRCFQTCRRKHYYQYEMGIERFDAEDREALVFGSLFHLALEAWWSFFLVGDDSHGNCSNLSVGRTEQDSSASQATVVS
jgi:hypothetical protein